MRQMPQALGTGARLKSWRDTDGRMILQAGGLQNHRYSSR